MMTNNKRVIRNIMLVFSSEGIGGILSFIIVLISARLLGVDDFGVLSYILAITSVCQLVADFGLTNLIVREVAKNKERAQYIMSNVLTLAWVMSLIIILVVGLIAYISLDNSTHMAAAIIMGVAVLATYHSVVFSSVCRAFEQMGYNAFSFVVHKVILLGLILLLTGPLSPFDSLLIGITTAYLLANLCQYFFFLMVVSRRFIRFGFGKDIRFCFQLLVDAIPIGASMVIRRLTLHVDILILSALAVPSAVGIFSAAYKVVQIVDMIPFAICLPLFPALSRLANNDVTQLETFFARSLTGFLIISIPITGYLFISADNIVNLFYGSEYRNSSAVLQILAFSIVGLFVNMLLSYLFIALNKQRFYLLSAATCLGINGLVDFALIPFLGEVGAAWGTLVGELSYFILCVFFLKKLQIHYAWLSNFWRPMLITISAAGICSLGDFDGVKGQLLITVIFILCYVLGLFLLQVVKISDLKHFMNVFLSNRDDKKQKIDNISSGTN